jgi:hypothetical protein
LKWLPLKQRLESSLTSRSFHAAAVAALQEIEVNHDDFQLEDICMWLQQHPSLSLTRLSMASDLNYPHGGNLVVHLSRPCVALHSLCLGHVRLAELHDADSNSLQEGQPLHEAAASTAAAPAVSLAALTALTSLQLDQVVVDSSTHIHNWTASQLSHLTRMQRLQLHGLRAQRNSLAQRWVHSEGVGAALGQLVQLTSLSLGMDLDGSVLAAASRLSRLQHLQLVDLGSEQVPLRLQDLPCSLTSLSLEQCRVSIDDAVGSRRALAGLQQLQLTKMPQLPAGALRLMPQLRSIICTECELHKEIWLKYQHVTPVSGSHAEQLCSMLPVLQHLQHMELSNMRHPLQAAGYAGLTAGRQLTALIMSDWSPPPGAARHMFPLGRQLLGLHRLQIRFADTEYDALRHTLGNASTKNRTNWIQATSWALEPGDVGRLIACCPALRELSVVLAGADISASELELLLQLTALTRLSIGGERWDAHTASSVLAQMTGGL